MKSHLKTLSVLLVTAAWLTAIGGGESQAQPLSAPHVAGRLLVQLRPEALARPDGPAPEAAAVAGTLARSVGASRARRWLSGAAGPRRALYERTFIFDFPMETDLSVPLAKLRSDPRVELAALDYLFAAADVPAGYDPGLHWALAKTGADRAWAFGAGGAGALVAIIDTGVEWYHPDLIRNIWINPEEDTDDKARFYLVDPYEGYGRDFPDRYPDKKDNDGNGYVDDLIGWDFVDLPDWEPVTSGEDREDRDNDPDDFAGHGTKVAGAAGADSTDGVYSTLGMAWSCTILPIRAGYQPTEGPGQILLGAATEGIYYALDAGADVINLSFSTTQAGFGDGEEFGLMRAAIDSARAHGITVVAAAGAALPGTEPNYPAAFDGVIAVGATDALDRLVLLSAYGDWIDLVAPGFEIFTTARGSGHEIVSGTSMSAALVSGAAALLRGLYPDSSSGWIERELIGSGDNVDAANPGLRGLLGGGRLNVYRALTGAVQPDLSVARVAMVDDSTGVSGSNRDGRLDPGETASVRVTVINHPLGRKAVGAKATIIDPPPEISVLESEADYDDLAPGHSALPAAGAFKLRAAADMKPQEVALRIRLSSGGGSYTNVDSLRLWIGRPPVLLLAFDGTGQVQGTYGALRDSLDSPFELRELTAAGPWMASELLKYEAVVLAVGAKEDSLIHSRQRIGLIDFLLAGRGLLLISGNCFPTDEPLLTSFLKCGTVTKPEPVPNQVRGLGGDPISMGIEFTIDPSRLCSHGFHRLRPIETAQLFLSYQGESSAAGVRYENPDSKYRSAVIAVGLDAILDDPYGFNQGQVLLQRTLDWLLETSHVETSEAGDGHGRPGSVYLAQNFPNPFNAGTSIRFEVDRQATVTLRVYNLNGRLIKSLIDGELPPGRHIVPWDGRDTDGQPAPSGVYFARLTVGRETLVRKMVLLK